MGKYIGRKLLQFLIIMVITSVIIFIMVRLSKSDPLTAIVGGKQTTAETLEQLKIKFGLDKSFVQQYFSWIGGLFRGELGMSFKYQMSINELFADRFPITIGLVLLSTIIALVIAIPSGVLAAVKKNRAADRIISIISVFLAGCPPFFMSLLFILFIARYLPSYQFTGGYSNFREYFLRILAPSIALAFTMIALACRITRASMIEQLNAQYTQTAVSKGVTDRQLVWGHNFRNAVIPVLSVVSVQIGGMIAGSVLVENVFSLSGLGTLLIDSIKTSDYVVVQDITMLMVLIFMVISTLVDILYALIDPRIRAN